MSETGVLTVSKVDNVEYLRPPLLDPTAVETATTGSIASDTPARVIPVIVALGGCFILVAVVAAYRYRRESEDKLEEAIDNVGSHITSAPSSESGNSIPFSGIFRYQGKAHNDDNMSAIMEDSADSGSSAPNTSIIVSEGGYTDDDSRDTSYMNSILQDESMLGARQVEEIEPEDDYLFDHDDVAEN